MSDQSKEEKKFSLEEHRDMLKAQLESIEAEKRALDEKMKQLKAVLKAYDKQLKG